MRLITQGRRTAGLIEEVALIDGEDLNEIVLPLMNINRRTKAGLVNPEETHQAQIYVTTAGYKNTFAYDKLIQLFSNSIINPKSAFVWGGDYRIPVMHGLLSADYIEELKQDTTYSESSFMREYLSVWSGNHDESFFNADKLNSHRTIAIPDPRAMKVGEDSFYLLSVDVGRLVAQTVVTVFRVARRKSYFLKSLVNIFTFQDMHFSQQACRIKELATLFEAEEIVIDGNGLGVGLLDYMIQTNVDEKTGREWPPIGSHNDKDYKEKQPYDAPQLMYIIKANNTLLTDVHTNALTQINSGKVKMLVDERAAKTRLNSLKKSKNMTLEDRLLHLLPYQLTSILIDEMLNLRMKATVTSVVGLERMRRSLGQDKFSAFEYGLWRIREIEEAYYKKLRKKRDLSKFIIMH